MIENPEETFDEHEILSHAEQVEAARVEFAKFWNSPVMKNRRRSLRDVQEIIAGDIAWLAFLVAKGLRK